MSLESIWTRSKEDRRRENRKAPSKDKDVETHNWVNNNNNKYSWSVRQTERTEKEKIRTWRIWDIKKSEQKHPKMYDKGQEKLNRRTICSETGEKQRGHDKSWKTWLLSKKGKLLESKSAQKMPCRRTRNTESIERALLWAVRSQIQEGIHQFWTFPRQIQRKTIPSFAKMWRL